MRCNEALNILDEYLDEDLAFRPSRELETHVARCGVCQDELAQRRELRVRLANLAVAGPSEDFFDRALANAAQIRTRRRSDGGKVRGKTRKFALAAAVACAFAAAVALQQPSIENPFANVPEATIAMHEVTPVNLVFWAERELQDARLSIQLPEGIELAGYEKRSALTWTTDLEAGRNLLRLPLVGHVATAKDVTATLEHPQGTKKFRLKITVI